MAAAEHVAHAVPVPSATPRRVWMLRIAIIVVVLAAWEALAASVWLFRDVVPSLTTIGRAVGQVLTSADFYRNLGVTLYEIGVGLLIGGSAGIVVGIVLGANRFLAQAYEALLYYLGPTPKIIFFPVMIMWFGVGAGSQIATGALSCFVPSAIRARAGVP